MNGKYEGTFQTKYTDLTIVTPKRLEHQKRLATK